MLKRTVNWRRIPSDCPIKHRKQIETWLNELPRINKAIEIGCYLGSTTSLISQFADFVLAIDIWSDIHNTTDSLENLGQSKYFRWFLRHVCCNNLQKIIHPVVSNSSFLDWLYPLNVDFVFIDGSHDYQAVKNDLHVAKRHLAERGLIVCHDYHKSWDGVVKAVDEFIEEGNFSVYDKIDGLIALKWK